MDGQEQDIYVVKHAFIGFPLSRGEYDIEMTYVSLFFKESAVISILTLVMSYTWRRRRMNSMK